MVFALFSYLYEGGMNMDQTLLELEREALLLAFGKGSWDRYYYLKGKADAELEAYLKEYESNN